MSSCSSCVNVDDCLGKGGRRFLRQVVPDTPCKKPTMLYNTFPQPPGSAVSRRQSSALANDFGTPPATVSKRLSLFKSSLGNRRLFDMSADGGAGDDGDDDDANNDKERTAAFH